MVETLLFMHETLAFISSSKAKQNVFPQQNLLTLKGVSVFSLSRTISTLTVYGLSKPFIQLLLTASLFIPSPPLPYPPRAPSSTKKL